VNFEYVVSNAGPSDGDVLFVGQLIPPGASAVWTCVPSGGASTCPAPSGTTNLNLLLHVAVGTSITIDATVAVPAAFVGSTLIYRDGKSAGHHG
jgi:hypothetical protein